MTTREIGLGILGLGTVGRSVVELIRASQDSLSRRLGANLVVRKIAVRDPYKERKGLKLPMEMFTTSLEEVVRDPTVDIVVELIGGTEEARYAVIEAIENQKQVVTANKALIAVHGRELYELAHQKQRDLFFEAAVCGGIPILRILREAYVGNRIYGFLGIVNGTCNFILSEMTEASLQGQRDVHFEGILLEAQEGGYAEADPTMDVDGTDAAQKLAILASLAYGGWVDYRQILKEGITALKPLDFEMADYFGFRIKLLAIARDYDGALDLRVHPTLIAKTHLLATVDGVYNAIYIQADPLGPSMLYGKGAGGGPTASAVVGDIVDVARNLLSESAARVPVLSYEAKHIRELPLFDGKNLVKPYYLRFMVVDRPGVLSSITNVLGKYQISIAGMVQKERGKLKPVPVVMLTHDAKEENIRKAVEAIDLLDVIVDRSVVIRVEG